MPASRMNMFGAVSLVCLLIGTVWYTTEDDTETAVVILLWIGCATALIQFFWNLFAFGEPAMGEEFRRSKSLVNAGAAGADSAQVNALELENAELRRKVQAGDEKLQDANATLERELRMAQSRLGALKDEISGAEERFHKREDNFKENISDLQAQIGELKEDGDKRTKVVEDARVTMDEMRPYIGILIEDIPKREKREQNLQGVRIQTVKPDTPAASVGFEAGDIIERMNSADMTSSEDVMKHLTSRKPGDVCSFIVNRKGDFTNIVMEVGHKVKSLDEVHRLRRIASGLIKSDDLTEA